MRLLSITARNFRSLQNICLKFSGDYCTISGKNNAGKSSVIRLLSLLFGSGQTLPWVRDISMLDYKDDVTQWAQPAGVIEVTYRMELSADADPALISFIERIANTKAPGPAVCLDVQYQLASSSDDLKVSVSFGEQPLGSQESKDIDKKIRESNLLFLYNSTTHDESVYYSAGRRRRFYDFVMSHQEEKDLEEAARSVDKKLRRIAKQHTQGLNAILGRLVERFDVEFSPPGKFSPRHAGIGINLRDKYVEVPLSDWGSGTQNRTQILMSILQANRIKTTYSLEDKITPIVVIEEPESFLHPSAQSEFGRILGTLAAEFGVQIVATTHSPYMLNREDPGSNILLCRESKRGKQNETRLVDTSGASWMAPFAEHLGINPTEFVTWQPFFSGGKKRVLLVEGEIDKQYFEQFQQRQLPIEGLSKDIEIVPYGGKDTLKNTLLLRFVLSAFDRVFITYDLDADADLKKSLSGLGLKQNEDFLPLGDGADGKDCIEGLLPHRILSAVCGRETDLVMKLSSSKGRKEAKQGLKNLYLEEFKGCGDYTKDELRGFEKVIKLVNKVFAKA